MNKSTIVIGTIVAVVTGLVGINTISETPFLVSTGNLNPNESAFMIGHVEYVLRGPDGEIKQYIQSDNIIVDNGKDCAAQAIFNNSTSGGDTSGTDNICVFTSGSTGFNYIAIGNGTGSENGNEVGLATTGTGINGACTASIETCEFTNSDNSRIQGSTTFTEATGGNGNTQVVIATVSPFAFTQLGSNGTTVTQSGLFDDATLGSDSMFAVRTISVPVTNQDTLSVTWTITLS